MASSKELSEVKRSRAEELADVLKADSAVDSLDVKAVFIERPGWAYEYSVRVPEENADGVNPTVMLGSNFANPVVITGLADFSLSNGDRSSDMDSFEPTLTRQEFKDECDINTLMAQYDNALAQPFRDLKEPFYLDLTEAPPDLMSAMQVMNDASAAFMTLPAKVRREFDNDPRQFVAFAQDKANVEKMREWGLAPPPEAPKPPLEVRVIPDPDLPPAPKEPSKPA